MSKFCLSKKGFGLLEVIVAAVVLGFMIVGLNMLQKGNRESILRVRTRDAANFVAQHVLDSLGALGINSLVADANNKILFDKDKNEYTYTYHFEGKNVGKIAVEYTVAVTLNNDDTKKTIDSTQFTIARRQKKDEPSETEKNIYAKNLEATVSWKFGNSPQAIKMAKVVR
jgi:prepilin-type N-terminal cleavage/methylation domain-containing protein